MDIRLLIILPALVCHYFAIAQEEPSLKTADTAKLNKLSRQYINAVSGKSDQVSKDIDKQTARYLDKLQKQEARLQKKVAKIDSLAAHNIFANSAAKYQQLQNDIKNKSEKLQRSTGLYIPFTDTAANSLKFLYNNPLTGKLAVSPAQMKDALNKVKELEAQLRSAEKVKDFIRQRKQYLQQQLAKYNLGSDLKKYNATAYYYSQQLNDYKAILNDHHKAEQKALTLLRQYGPFQAFMKKYGVLAGLFDVPADYAGTGVGSLQTVGQVQNLLNQRIGTTMGANGMQTVQASLSAAQSELSKLRNKISQNSNGDLPEELKPQSTKTMPFKKRLVFGFDMSSTKSNALIPLYTDFALTAGYRLMDKLTVSIGGSYKIGWGSSWQHIHLSSQGVGIRSELSWKIKTRYFLLAGAEANYLNAFKNIKELNNYSAWSLSALTGIGRNISLKSKFFKCTKASICYDWLHAVHVPKTPAFVFRAGYSF